MPEMEEQEFKERFARFSGKAEQLLLRTTAFFFILLILIQLLWQVDPIRRFFVPVEKMEGIPVSSQTFR